MSPGAGGAGRPTGTVPKTKPHDAARDQRRDNVTSLNHVSNNLLALDWQAAQTYERRTRKNSNRSFSDHYELPPLPPPTTDGGGSSHDNRCVSTYTPPDSSQWSSPGRTPPSVEVASPARDHSQRNVLRDKSNISKTADRGEVASRLDRLCDYIKQTSYLVDTLNNSENPNLVERGTPGASPGYTRGLSRASSQARHQPGAERDELRMKVEESQRKLQALQEHQAALAALQDTARQQLADARQEQSVLLVRCSAGDGEESVDDAARLDVLQRRLQSLAEMCHDRNQEAGDASTEEQAVNLRRQNVRGPSAQDDLASDIHVRTRRLQDAQGRLVQLQELMALVTDAHASGHALPDDQVDALLRDTSTSPHRTGQDPHSTQLGKEVYPALRHKKTNSQSQLQLLSLELQAKRLDLEALMSKDQSLPSVLNHDRPHHHLPPSSVAEALPDTSPCYSSDEAEQLDLEQELAQSARQPLDMPVSVDSYASLQARPHRPGCVSSRLPWTTSANVACGRTAPPSGDYAPPSNGPASALSNPASTHNVCKSPHLQVDGSPQVAGGWGVVYSPLPGDQYYQQLLATSQMQQQNMVLTMLNQCCQLLWLQQRDLQALRTAVHSLQERGTEAGDGAQCRGAGGYGLFLPAQDEVQLNNCFTATPTLNNQVPPGNRANNYWDNFRSYSRQNLLSGGAGKSNEEGAGHSPSPLAERSHNSLQAPALSLGAAALPLQAECPRPAALPATARKDQLNAATAVKKQRRPNPKITCAAPRNTHKSAAGPAPVHEEVAALISANENRPDFLRQLFRQLRVLNSDPRRLCSVPQLEGDGLAAAVPEALPRNAARKVKDLMTPSPELQLGHCPARANWHAQCVVAELRPLLSVHEDDVCTPALLDMLRTEAVQMLPHLQMDTYCCSRLDTVLRDALQRFLYCRLGSVSEQLLGVVAELVQADQLCRPPTPAADITAECREWQPQADVFGENELPASLPPPTVPGVAQMGPDVYNGDLAEADQSCHPDHDDADNSCDGEVELAQETCGSPACAEPLSLDTGVSVPACAEPLHLDTAVGADWEPRDCSPPRTVTSGSQSA